MSTNPVPKRGEIWFVNIQRFISKLGELSQKKMLEIVTAIASVVEYGE